MTPCIPSPEAVLMLSLICVGFVRLYNDGCYVPTLEERTDADGFVSIDRAQMQRDCYTTMSVK